MRLMKVMTASLAACCVLMASVSAHAAVDYTLTCSTQSGSVIFTTQVSGVNLDNPGISSTKVGATASGKNSGPTFTVQLPMSGQVYGALFQSLAQNQTIPSCTVSERKTQGGNAPQVAFQWTYQNVQVADLALSGGQGGAEGSVQAAFTAQRVSFTSK